MMLKELTAVPNSALPLDEFADHLRLGTGFSGARAEETALIAYLRAAMAAIEGRTAKVLISRDFRMTLGHWRSIATQPLPVAPVNSVNALRIIDDVGAETEVAANRFRLMPDTARPRLEGRGGMLPGIPDGGRVEIEMTAGFGPNWTDLPVDLAQAVFLLAAQYYEMRHDAAQDAGGMPFGVTALIERWRTVRVLGGRP